MGNSKPMMRTMLRAVAIAAILMVLTPPAVFAASPESINRTEEFRGAGAAVDRLQVYEIAGIVILRGRAQSKAQAEEISQIAQKLGYLRVANLIQIIQHNDEQIAREAEVKLANHRSLDGCRFSVRSAQGVVHVGGQVTHELQKDVALLIVRQINGVLGVEVDLKKF